MLDVAIDLALARIDQVGTIYVGEKGQRQAKARCPFHDDRSPSFGINVDTGEWNCFSGCGGGWLDTLLERLGFSPSKIKSLLGDLPRPESRTTNRYKLEYLSRPKSETVLPEKVLDLFYGCPLDMVNDGWDESVLFEFDIGYDRGQERITFPIRDPAGNLIGISGRTPFRSVYPRYLLYTEEHLYDLAPDGYFPDRSRFIFNSHRAMRARRGEIVAVCEGFKGAMRLHEAGIVGVALAGAMYSKNQIRVLNKIYHCTGCTFAVLFDNDGTGRKQANKICRSLSRFTMPRIAFTDDAKDVSDIDDLKVVRRTAIQAKTFLEWHLENC